MATIINFTIFATTLFLLLRNPIRKVVRERHFAIKEDVETTRVRLREAKEAYEEFSAKLKAIDAEVDAVRAQSRKEAEGMKSRILTSSQTLAGALVADAKSGAGNLVSDLKGDLRSEFGLRIVDKAEAIVRGRLTGDDQARIRREFSTQMAKSSQMESVG